MSAVTHESWTHTVGGHQVTVRVGLDAKGSPVSVRMDMDDAKIGSPEAAFLACICKSITVGLANGAPLDSYLRTFRGTKFAPSGATSDLLAAECSSLVDYLARTLEARGYGALGGGQ